MEEIKLFARQAKERGQQIVLVTGVFDLLHQEHRNFLTKARQAGDILLVGVETDQRAKQLKGVRRPINNEDKRFRQLNALPVVDKAFLLPEAFANTADHLALLIMIRPDVLAVSSHTPFLNKKKKLIQQVGGELKIVHQFNHKISTSNFLAQINHKK
jgi:D-beta-D-heptose 7-phosphate kinase / D-beta-D-heptose 1-phosphate adenosyltransferase